MENTCFIIDDGSEYEIVFEMMGGRVFKFFLINGLLILFIGGLYRYWVMVKYMNLWNGSIFLIQGGCLVEEYCFVGGGGGYLWCELLYGFFGMIMFFIYFLWGQCKMKDWFVQNIQVDFKGVIYFGCFVGKGGLFWFFYFKGFFFMFLMFGIYGVWWLIELVQFNFYNYVFEKYEGE